MSTLYTHRTRCPTFINLTYRPAEPARRFFPLSCSYATKTRRPTDNTDEITYNPLGTTEIKPPTTKKSTSSTTIDVHPTIFSGIQPTGVPHLGNYLGALRSWKRLQDDLPSQWRLFYSIVDLHALTSLAETEPLPKCTKEAVAALLAIGLDPRRCTIFCQSDVPAHSELMWILSTIVPTGKLTKMTQWKSKIGVPFDGSRIDSTKAKLDLKLGLYSYPILQAADILIYRATSVPVGEDQVQHLELARDLASAFNRIAPQPVFPLPKTLISGGKRIMSFKDPTKKMSKSDPSPISRILINDERNAIANKISKALTDSHTESITYNPSERPGIANLINILKETTLPNMTGEEIAQEFDKMKANVKVKHLKQAVADSIETELGGVRTRFNQLIHTDPDNLLRNNLEETLFLGKMKANAAASTTLKMVREAIGLHNWDTKFERWGTHSKLPEGEAKAKLSLKNHNPGVNPATLL